MTTSNCIAILDTEREAQFDDILWLATNFCETKMGALSLVDGNRQWFKSQVNIMLAYDCNVSC